MLLLKIVFGPGIFVYVSHFTKENDIDSCVNKIDVVRTSIRRSQNTKLRVGRKLTFLVLTYKTFLFFPRYE